VSWTIPQQSSFVQPSVDIIKKAHAQTDNTSTSSQLTGAETLQLWKTATDGGNPGHAVGEAIYLNCISVTMPYATTNMSNNTHADVQLIPGSPIYAGSCPMTIPNDIPEGSYVVRMFAADGTTVLGDSPVITITAGAQLSAWPNPCMLTDYGTCSSIISWNVPNATNAAGVTVKVKGEGATKSLFANAPFGSQKAGWITENGATFELYVDDAPTPIRTLTVTGVQLISQPIALPARSNGGSAYMSTSPTITVTATQLPTATPTFAPTATPIPPTAIPRPTNTPAPAAASGENPAYHYHYDPNN
jgi:hypothetical protein